MASLIARCDFHHTARPATLQLFALLSTQRPPELGDDASFQAPADLV